MVNQRFSAALIRLVEFDQETKVLEDKRCELEKGLLELRTGCDALDSALEGAHHDVRAARKEVDENERAIREIEEQERAKIKRLDLVGKQREYDSLRDELNVLQGERARIETILVGSWNRLEGAEKKALEYKKKHAIESDEFGRAAHTTSCQIKEIDDLLQQRVLERQKLVQEITPEWLATYETMRTQVPNPLVPIHEGSCSGCFYAVPNQDRLALQAGKLCQCKWCYRFLYNAPAQESS